MDSNNLKTNKDWALYYFDQGWCIIPARGKIPAVKWEQYQTKRPTKEQVEKWWDSNPNFNIALVTGAISGVVAVDVDGVKVPAGLPPTPIVETSPGRYHYYFKHPGFLIKNAIGELVPGVDFKGDEGITILPPSTHFNKGTGKPDRQYKWALTPKQVGEFADLPQWVIDGIKAKKPIQEIAKGTTKGSRNSDTTSYIGYLLHNSKDLDNWQPLWEMVKAWNLTNVKPPQEESAVWATFKGLLDKEKGGRGEQKDKEIRTPIDFQALEEVVHKWLLIKDKGIIRVVAGSVIANKLKADPVWLFIVTASGGTKTELLRGLNKIDGIYPLSDLTPQTFLSGEKGNKNASLLLRLPSEVILTQKDFTTVLTMHRDKRHAILSQLREIYDGQFKKEFGTGESKEWNGKMGFLAGVTSVIDHHYSIYQTLGERFIQYRPVQPNPIELSLKAMNNAGNEIQMREEIQNAFADFIAGVKIPDSKIDVSEDLKNNIAYLSTFCVRARSGVVREGYSTREIELIPEAELPTRLSKQLITLASAFSLISGEFSDEDYELIYKIGMDTLPQTRRQTLEVLIKSDDYLETAEIAMNIDYPTNTTRRILEDLHGLRLINRQSQGRGYADRWIMRDDTRELLDKSKPESQKTNNKDGDKDPVYKEAEKIFGVLSVPEMSGG